VTDPHRYRVAAIQFSPEQFAREANIARLEAMTIEAARNGAKLIVHPEMGTTGYCWASREEIAPYVEPVPGPTTDRFAEIAAEHDCWIVVGMPEVSEFTGIYYNSAVLIGPDGVAGLYRKTHSFIAEPAWAKDGDLGLPVFDTPLGRIGLLICMDVVYFETARLQALQETDVICLLTNWVGDGAPAGSWITRALENGVYVIASDRADEERGARFCGGTCVIDPDGTVQAEQASGDGIVYGEIDPGALRRDERLAERRPELYRDLIRNTYLWNPEAQHGLYGLKPLPPGRQSRVALAQFTPAPGDTDGNLETIAELAAQAAGADLLVLPELAVTGPILDREQAERLAEALPGPIAETLQGIAGDAGVHLVAGLVERGHDGRLFNTAVVVNGDGLVTITRKAHLSADDRGWAAPGDLGLVSVDLPVGRVGLLIGHDLLMPEAARVLAINGADLIACPSLLEWPPRISAGGKCDRFVLFRERARENKLYLAVANGAEPYTGLSGIYGPDPEDYPDDESSVPHAEPGLIANQIDTSSPDPRYPTNPVRLKTTLGMRQPIWYDMLQVER
jgi:predicted amidohydrolase